MTIISTDGTMLICDKKITTSGFVSNKEKAITKKDKSTFYRSDGVKFEVFDQGSVKYRDLKIVAAATAGKLTHSDDFINAVKVKPIENVLEIYKRSKISRYLNGGFRIIFITECEKSIVVSVTEGMDPVIVLIEKGVKFCIGSGAVVFEVLAKSKLLDNEKLKNVSLLDLHLFCAMTDRKRCSTSYDIFKTEGREIKLDVTPTAEELTKAKDNIIKLINWSEV